MDGSSLGGAGPAPRGWPPRAGGGAARPAAARGRAAGCGGPRAAPPGLFVQREADQMGATSLVLPGWLRGGRPAGGSFSLFPSLF